MKRSYVIGIDGQGVAELVKGLEDYKRCLIEKSKLLVSKLADEGYKIADAGFQSAEYDGTKDAHVSVEDRGDRMKAVVGLGSTALFIEFGTGVTYPDIHPEAGSNGMIRGGYGKGHGKQRTWGYYGDPGTNGVPRETNHGTVVLTHGNPANMPMYTAAKSVNERLSELVKEVFGSD